VAEISIVRLGPDDWPAYRILRLAALADAPHAFGSTLAREVRLTPPEWRARILRGGTFMARRSKDPVGTAAGIPGDEPGHAELVGMWVHPDWRGHGVGDNLVEAVMDWAAAGPYRYVNLWVSEGNDPAERLYTRHGFVRTGATQPVRLEEPEFLEWEMVVALG